jgi:simple sugar transport system substrate-binding protein
MKKLISAILCMAMVLCVFTACDATSRDNLVKVGIINNPPDESGYREANVKDFEDVFSTENGYETVTFYSLNHNEQLNAAKQFIADGVDYILISAASTDGWDGVLNSARDAGIKVFLFDRMINCSVELYEAAVVSDMARQGELAVKWLKEQELEVYNVVHIQGVMGSDAQIGRTAALDREFANGSMNKVVQKSAAWNEEEATQIVRSVIESGVEFNVIYAENDGMARGAVSALSEAGISHGVDNDVIIMGFDCNRWALRELLAGNWNYNGQCSPFQAAAIDEMIKTGIISAKKVISDEKSFDARTITQEDIDNYGLGE